MGLQSALKSKVGWTDLVLIKICFLASIKESSWCCRNLRSTALPVSLKATGEFISFKTRCHFFSIAAEAYAYLMTFKVAVTHLG